MVAEHDHRLRTQVAHEAQNGEGLRTAVDEVADKPEPVAFRELTLCEQGLQLVEAALHVANCISRHRLEASIEPPILYRLCDVLGADRRGPGQVSDAARHPQHTVV